MLYLYLYNLSGGVLAPPDTDTGLSVRHEVQRGALHGGQPVPGQHDRGEVHPAALGRDQRPDGLDQHLTCRTIRGRGEIYSFRPGLTMRALAEKARQTENEGEFS